MYGFLLQDWVTINGSANSTLIQSESAWLSCSDIQDLTFWLDVRNIGGTVSLYYETSPTKDDGLFVPMVAARDLPYYGASSTVVITTALSGVALVPPAAWVRWRLAAGASAYNTTFRIHVTGNRVGVALQGSWDLASAGGCGCHGSPAGSAYANPMPGSASQGVSWGTTSALGVYRRG